MTYLYESRPTEWFYTKAMESDDNYGGHDSKEKAAGAGLHDLVWEPEGEQREACFFVFQAAPKTINISKYFDVEDWWRQQVEGPLAEEFWDRAENPESLRSFASDQNVEHLKASMKNMLDGWQREKGVTVKTGFMDAVSDYYKVVVVRTADQWRIENMYPVEPRKEYGRAF